MIENAAVFINGQRKFKGVNVKDESGEIVIINRVNGQDMARYSVVAVAKAGMAWDVENKTISQEGDAAVPTSLVAQQGCGCSGMRPYDTDPEYTGPNYRGLHRR